MTHAHPVDVLTSDSPPAPPDPDAPATVRSWGEVIGTTAVGLAVGLLILLHLFASDLNPVSSTLSDYALGSYGWVLDFATLALAVGSVALLGPLLLYSAFTPTVCFGCWCLGLVTLTVFPRDPIGVPVSLVGEIHRYAAVVTLIGLPVGALAIAVRYPGALLGVSTRPLTILAVACLVALVPFVFAYLAGSPLSPFVGLIERAVATAELVLLVLVGTRLDRRRAVWGAQPD